MIYDALNNRNTANGTTLAGKHGMLEDHFHLKDMECWNSVFISKYGFSSHEVS